MLGKTTNPILQKTEQAIQAKVPANLQPSLDKAVHAGLTIMYSPQGSKIMQQIFSKPGDQASNVAEGAAKLLGEMMKQSKMTLSMKVGVPAATILMCEGLDFMEQSGRIKVTNDVVAEATKDLGAYVMKLVGVTPDKLAQMQANAQQASAKGIIGSQIGA